MSPEDWRRPIVSFGRSAFAFLEERGASVELDDESLQSTLAYVLPDACFEIEFDWREEAAFVLVCRRTPEGRPPGYYTHGGLTMRVHLAEALERTGLAEAGLRERSQSTYRDPGPGAMNDQLVLFGSVLHKQLDKLLRRYDRVFLPPER